MGFSSWHSRRAWSRALHLTVRFVLGGLFAWAGIVKLTDPRAFAATMSRFDLVPEPLLPVAAIGLPLVEIAAGVGLMVGLPRSLAAVFLLLVMFIAVLWYGILQGLEFDCGCFSLAEQEEHGTLWTAFWRDWLMLAGVVYLWFGQRRLKTSRSLIHEEDHEVKAEA